MLQGVGAMLKALQRDRPNIAPMVVARMLPAKLAVLLGAQAVELIVDMGYLRVQRQWYAQVADNVPCAMYQVSTDPDCKSSTVRLKRTWSCRCGSPVTSKSLARVRSGRSCGRTRERCSRPWRKCLWRWMAVD